MDAMGFSVNAKALGGLADMLDRRAHDLLKTAGYVTVHSTLQGGPGLVNVLSGAHGKIVDEIVAFLRRAATSYLTEYSIAVSLAVEAYTTSDQGSSARLDASLPGLDSLPPPSAQPADQSVGPEIFTDPAKLVLKIPPDYHADFPYQPSWADVISPTSIPRDVIWAVSHLAVDLGLIDRPVDPYEAFTVPLFGDWAGLERFSFALRQTVQALSYVCERVDSGTATQDRIWTGHAATNCAVALGRFTFDLQDAQGLLQEIANSYHDIAVSARAKEAALASLVSVAIDVAATFGVEAFVEAPRAAEAASKLATVLPDIMRGIEGLHASVEGGKSIAELRADDLVPLLTGSMNASLPGTMPALPTPARG